MVCSYAAGIIYSAGVANTFSSKPLTSPVDRVMVEGWLEEVSSSGSSSRYVIDVQSISNFPKDQTPEKVRLTIRGEPELIPGRYIRCFASLRPPPSAMLPGDYNFAQQAYFQKLGAVGFVFGRCNPGRLSEPDDFQDRLRYRINSSRHALAERLSQTNGGSSGAALAAAVMTGDRSFLSEDVQEDLRGSGLAHLLAISGLHMGLAAGAFYFVLFRLLALVEPLSLRVPVQKIAGIGALLAITIYLVFSGASISTQRAYVMLGTGLLFGLLDRPVVSFQALAFAMFAVVLISPWAVTTPGFQMSFAATAALIAAYRHRLQSGRLITSKGALGKFREFLYGVVLTSWVAGLATLPFALYHFDRAAPLGFFANLFVMPIVTLVSVPLAAITAILLPFGWEDFSLFLLARSLDLVFSLASFFADDRGLTDWASLGRIPLMSAIAVSMALIIWVIHGKSQLKWSVLITGLAVLGWMIARSPDVVYDGAGHIFVKLERDWHSLDTGVRGLEPLRYVDAPVLECDPDCTHKVGAESFLSFTRSTGELTITRRERDFKVAIDLQSPSGRNIYISANGPDIKFHPQPACRPWSKTWPACRE